MAAGNGQEQNNDPGLFTRLSHWLSKTEDAVFYFFFPKTRLDLLYANLHEAEKELDELLPLLDTLKQKKRNFEQFIKISTTATALRSAQAEIADQQTTQERSQHLRTQANEYQEQKIAMSRELFQLRKELSQKVEIQEYIAKQTHDIKLHKANRKWYDVSKWSTNEKIARVWYAFLYALLCGISIFASVSALGLPFSPGLIVFTTLFAAAISFAVNLNGFWDNVAKLLDESHKEEIKGNSSTAYKIFCVLFAGVGAFLSTGMALSTVATSLGIAALPYWAIFPILFIFATTVKAVQGLFTQEPRKWFKSFGKFGFRESIIRTAIRLWYGMSSPLYGDKPRSEWGAYPETTFLAGLSRVGLFLLFAGITTYAATATAPFAATASLNLFYDLVRHVVGGPAWELATNLLVGSFFTYLPIIPVLSFLFVGYMACYGAALSGKLSILATDFIGKCATLAATPYQHELIAGYPERIILLTLTGILPLISLGCLAKAAVTTLWEKEINCWTEAAHYSKIQVLEKNASMQWPHFIARLIYNHLAIGGTINALNNGALTTYGKFNGEDINLGELTEAEIIDASLAGGTGFTRSYGFFWLTKGPRDHEMQDQEKMIELKTRGASGIPPSKNNPSLTAEELAEYEKYKSYDEFFEDIPAPRRRPQ